jgi:antitoxin component YwqK of YwqJK toxin-antitoxin module
MIFWLKKKSNLKPIDKDQRQQCETLDGLKVISTEFVPDDYNGIVLVCKDGYVTSCAIFRNGKKNGKQELYDREGRTTSKMSFKDGQLHGRRQEWRYNNCIEIDEYYENGERNGTYFETNWKLDTSEGGTYRNGKKFGIWHYLKGNETYKKMTFENGIIVNEEKIIN